MKRNILLILSGILLVIGLLLFATSDGVSKSNYSKVISSYIKTYDEEEAKNINDSIKCFNSIREYGKKGNHIYAWVVSSCYYQKDDKVIEDSGYSMAFRFNLNGDKIVNFDTPEDGNEYSKSMKKLFPKSVIRKMEYVNAQKMIDEVTKQANEYYVNLDIYNLSKIEISSIITEKREDNADDSFKSGNKLITNVGVDTYIYDSNNERQNLKSLIKDDLLSVDRIILFLENEVSKNANNDIDNGYNKELLKDGSSILYNNGNSYILLCSNKDMYFSNVDISNRCS